MIIHPNQPLDNPMTWGDYYESAYGPTEGCCHFCGNVHSYEEMREFYDGHICDDCAVECPHCGDWLKDDPQDVMEGQRWHRACLKDAGYESEEERQAAYDACVDSQIEERKENRRIA